MIGGEVEEQTATTNEMVRNVNHAATVSARIVDNIKAVAGAAKSTTQGASETQAAARELSSMAGRLPKLVAQFKHSWANNAALTASKRTKSRITSPCPLSAAPTR